VSAGGHASALLTHLGSSRTPQVYSPLFAKLQKSSTFLVGFLYAYAGKAFGLPRVHVGTAIHISTISLSGALVYVTYLWSSSFSKL
jgi:hypothetical protein